VIHLYAVTDREGAPLRELSAGGVVAVFDEVGDPPDPTPDVLWKHEEVVESLMHERAVLPMRFGTCLPDEDAVRSLLHARGAEFERLLESVRDRVELAVRVTGEPAPPAGPVKADSGSEYMRRRLEAWRETQAIARAVHLPLARRAERSTSNLTPPSGGLMTGSYLLRRDGVEPFSAHVRLLQEKHPELTITCTGPWPPYSFVSEEGSS
jgi:hypothetical protein